MHRILRIPLILALLTLAACSGASEVGESPDVVGIWSYTISTSDGPYTGTLRITGTSVNTLEGSLVSETENNADYALESLAYDEGVLTFVMPHPEYGRLQGELTVDGDALTGALAVPGEGRFRMTGERTTD